MPTSAADKCQCDHQVYDMNVTGIHEDTIPDFISELFGMSRHAAGTMWSGIPLVCRNAVGIN